MEKNNRPPGNCYWVEPGKLLAGEYPGNIDNAGSREKMDALLESGITAFIDLTVENECPPYRDHIGNSYHQRFPIKDYSVPDSREKTISILDAIDFHIDQGGRVYLHCQGGRGRTGTIAGCWLARHGYQGAAALARLKTLWKQCPKSAYCDSPESAEQERYIVEWKEVFPRPVS